EHSQALRDDAGRMRTETDGVSSVMETLKQASDDAFKAGMGIDERTNTAAELEERLTSCSDQLGEVASTLERRVSRFKT
ncbi:MAG: hypothetical protein RQ801_07880, partial [Spirochaetaceae bacterium]|nr:hypothetical protein [Spirochaetaceae bacterium]